MGGASLEGDAAGAASGPEESAVSGAEESAVSGAEESAVSGPEESAVDGAAASATVSNPELRLDSLLAAALDRLADETGAKMASAWTLGRSSP